MHQSVSFLDKNEDFSVQSPENLPELQNSELTYV